MSSGIYIHIPFCKQACHYCNFHFSTSLKRKGEMVHAILNEIKQRESEVLDREISSIYLGGGTPSLLEENELNLIFESLHQHFDINPEAEITLEANPDDIQIPKIKVFADLGVNRLSIGIQSFFDEHLKWMNRSHSAKEAKVCIDLSRKAGIDVITCDLIFGIPGMTMKQWQKNLEDLAAFEIDHWSCYNLTVEPKTALAHQVNTGASKDVDDQASADQFLFLMDFVQQNGMEQYEISNYAKPGKYAVHNTNYWKGVSYLGLGPSAHSFDGNKRRRWNVANNSRYINSVKEGKVLFEEEILTNESNYNEYVMTGLRTKWGCSAQGAAKFGSELQNHFNEVAQIQIKEGNVIENSEGVIVLTSNGKLMADRVAMEFFWI